MLKLSIFLLFYLVAISFCLKASTAFAAEPKPEKSPVVKDLAVTLEVVKGKALVHRIKLDDYLKNLGPDETLEKMDSGGKGEPDIFIIYQKSEDAPKKLVMQLFDLNRDGKIDMVKHFEKGKMVKSEVDLDYDGYVDVVSEYDPKTGELLKKTQADGETNIWKYYTHNELRKKEIDRNSDGKPDMWVYYRGNKILKTEIDEKFDGKTIRRIDGPIDPSKGKKAASKPSAKVNF